MEGISDLKINGIDATRPPRIQKQPYINLFFKLSHKAPPDWCQEFNSLMSKHEYTPKINTEEGLFIETWVRSPEEIVPHLQLLKKAVTKCSEIYIENINRRIRESAGAYASVNDNSPQGRLNKIIAELDFSD